MKTEEKRAVKRKELERMFAKCQPIMQPGTVRKWMPIGKNQVYDLIHSGELRAFVYRGGYIVAKDDVIDYLLDHCDDPCPWKNRSFIGIKHGDEEE